LAEGAAAEGKGSPRVAFRGRLDALCAAILEAQVLGEREGSPGFVGDLEEALLIARSILPAEYKGTPMGEIRALGLGREGLRDRCRRPEKHFGLGHLLMDRSMGPLCARLNSLRALAREVELSAVAAFRDPASPSGSLRPDVLEALNGLSDLFYVLTYKHLPEGYSPRGGAGI